MKRRPNQMASTCPLASSRMAVVSQSRRRCVRSTRSERTVARTVTTLPGACCSSRADGQDVAPVDVVVREGRQQVADAGDAQASAMPSQGGGARQAGALDGRVEPVRHRGACLARQPAARGPARGRRRHSLLDRDQQVVVTLPAGHHLHLDVPALGRDGLGQRVDLRRGQARPW